MNRAEPCARIAARSSLSGADAAAAVEGVVPATASPPERAGAVNIAGWGSFADRHRAARRGGNPRTREAASIPVRAVVAFAAGRAVATGSTIGMARPGGSRTAAAAGPAIAARLRLPRRGRWRRCRCRLSLDCYRDVGLSGRSGQERNIQKSAIGHTCEHMRSHAPRLNPLARGFFISPRWEFPASPPLRAGAHIQYWQCCRCAYARPRSASERPRP